MGRPQRLRENREVAANHAAAPLHTILNARFIASGDGWCEVDGRTMIPVDRATYRRAKLLGHGTARHDDGRLFACSDSLSELYQPLYDAQASTDQMVDRSQ